MICSLLALYLLLATQVAAAPAVGDFVFAVPLVNSKAPELSVKERHSNALLHVDFPRDLQKNEQERSLVVRDPNTALMKLDRRFWNVLIWGAAHIVAAVVAVSVATVAATCGVGAALISKGFYLAGGLTCGVGLTIGLLGAAFAITSAYLAAAATITTAAVGIGLTVVARSGSDTVSLPPAPAVNGSTFQSAFTMHHLETGERLNRTHLLSATRESPLTFYTKGYAGISLKPVTYWKGINPPTNTTSHFIKVSNKYQLATPEGVKVPEFSRRDSHAHDWFYGFDYYGDAHDADFEKALNGETGFNYMVQGVADVIVEQESWETCICTKVGSTCMFIPIRNHSSFGRSREPRSYLESGLTDKANVTAPEAAPKPSAVMQILLNYNTNSLAGKSTGTIQGSWDDTYNGYTPCWSANCDGH